MASKKININDLKKTSTSTSQLADAFGSFEAKAEAVKTGKTSFEEIDVNEIKLDPKGEFQALFPLNEDFVEELAERIDSEGYDKSQCVHIASFDEEPETGEVLIDGAHRLAASKSAKTIDKIPVYRHKFKTRNDAKIYALELQLKRRNLDKSQLFKNFERLNQLKNFYSQETNSDSETPGKQASKDAAFLGTSTRQVEKMNAIENSDREDLKEALRNGSMTVNKAYDALKGKKSKKEKKEPENDISESLSSNEGNPAALSFDHSDHIERPDFAPFGSETDIEKVKRESYKEGFSDCIKKAEEILKYAIAQVIKGTNPKDVYFDPNIQFDYASVYNFNLPEEDEKIIDEL
ncbi:MAG: ParB/RepB/Spo0J family partition protein [Treponema sp.]|uniref:hypothetical protein n=1 Tax=Treponema sp. TaxID=166 RepID=UPI00298D9079|nr:hypothetical protein [Treponema sp.]MCQ2596580.1 ParB/RepB/Spo0J family partition protein [Treponema sp.]MCQ2601605.1 ParB/RepB/Spo0J family partition protein [Treponema sp.]